MTKKRIKELHESLANLEEAAKKYCITQGAVSERQRWYFLRCIHPIKEELKKTKKELKEALKNYNKKHDK